MKFPKYLLKFPKETIARYVGVTEGSVKRWQRDGLIPRNRVAAVRSLNKEYRPPSKRAIKHLLRQTPEVIADTLGVSLAKAESFIKKDMIPLDALDLYVTPRELKPVLRKLKVAHTKVRTTKRAYISEWEVYVGKELTHEVALEVRDTITNDKNIPDGVRLQGIVYGEAAIETIENKFSVYNIVEFKTENGVFYKLEYPTFLAFSRKVLAELINDRLLTLMDKAFLLECIAIVQITLIKRH